MKVRKLIALLLCLATVAGILPMSLSAEDAATPEYNSVVFDELLTFDEQTTGSSVSDANLKTMVSNTSFFSFTKKGSAATYSIPEGDTDNAFYISSGSVKGIYVNDLTNMLRYNSFVFSYDLNAVTFAAGYNTVRFAFTNSAGTTTTYGIMPVHSNGYTYCGVNNGTLSYTSGGQQPVTMGQWYHYDYYFNMQAKTISAYRDGAPIWTVKITDFTNDNITKIQLYIDNGSSKNAFYLDNLRIRSCNDADIDAALGFEGITFADGESSALATIPLLSKELSPSSGLAFSYVHASATTVEGSGTNNYIVGQVVGKTLGEGHKRSFFQLKDPRARLATDDWSIAFDMCLPGISDGTTDYSISNYEVSFFGLVTDNDKYNHIFTIKTNGTLGRATNGNYSSIALKPNNWYRIFASYNAEAQKISLAVLGNSEGYVDLGTHNFTPNKAATDTFFRFGYSYNTNQWCKFYFDNIVFTSKDKTSISLDFEDGTNGESISLSDLSLGGANTYAMLRGGAYSKDVVDSFKYVTESDGNTFLGSYVGHNEIFANIYDRSLKTTNQKFVISFDFKVNEVTTTYTMARWRTSNADIPLWIIETANGKCRLRIRPKLTGNSYAYSTPYLTSGTWYNFATLIDPVNKTAEFYMGGLDTEPIYTTSFDYNTIGSTWAAFSIGPGSNKLSSGANDYIGYDNIRIYTIDETIEEATPPSDINMSTLGADGVILETDFEELDAGTAMSSEVWNTVAPFGVTANDGIIVEANGNKHFQPMTGSGATSFNISSFNALPYLDGVIALESDFTLGDNSANSGNLVIAALKRVGIDGTTVNAPLLTADKNGKLTVAQHATDYTLPSETVRIRLEVCYAFHTVNLYVNGEAIATAIPLRVNTNLAIPEKYLIDSFGNKYELPFTGYLYDYAFDDNGVQLRDQNGRYSLVPHYYENYGYASSFSYIMDSIEMFNASASEAWSFAMDNLKIYLDKDADIYFNGFDSWASGVVGTSEYQTTVESPFAAKGAKFIDDGGNTVFSTVSEDSTVYNGSFFFTDKNKFLDGKTFVFEFDIKYNPDFENVNLGDGATNGLAILTDLDWHHTFRIYEDGRYGVPSAGVVDGYLKANDWSKVQVLFTPNASGEDHTARVYVDGILSSKSASLSFLHTLRLGCEANSYDAKFDNIRIYLSDKPEAFESVIKGSLDGKSLLSLEVSDTASLEKAMANKTAGLVWNFKNFDFSSNDINESTVNVLLNKGDYVRVVHNYIKDTSPYNIFVNKAALEGHKQYVFETEIRYTCPTGFELEVISTFDAATQSKDKLVYVLGTSREIVFNRNGFTYNLTDSLGNKLYAEEVTDNATEFTKIAVIVDEAAGNYSVYVNDNVAYYNYGGEIVTATAIDIDKTPIYEPSGLITSMASTLSLLNMPTSTSADALLDIKSANFYVLRTGVAPRVVSSQSKIEATKFDVRFIAPIDMLYGSEVGFDITTDQAGAKEVTRSTNFVFSSIKALDPESGNEIDVTAEEFDGTYLAVISVTGANVVDTVKFTVKPFIKIGDSKIYNESFTVTYSDGKAVTE